MCVFLTVVILAELQCNLINLICISLAVGKVEYFSKVCWRFLVHGFRNFHFITYLLIGLLDLFLVLLIIYSRYWPLFKYMARENFLFTYGMSPLSWLFSLLGSRQRCLTYNMKSTTILKIICYHLQSFELVWWNTQLWNLKTTLVNTLLLKDLHTENKDFLLHGKNLKTQFYILFLHS